MGDQTFTVCGFYADNDQTFSGEFVASHWREAARQAVRQGISVCAVYPGTVLAVDDFTHASDGDSL